MNSPQIPYAVCLCCGFQFLDPLPTKEVREAHQKRELEVHKDLK